MITAPAASGQRAAVLGLVGSRILAPGERRRIRLDELTLRLRQHGPRLTRVRSPPRGRPRARLHGRRTGPPARPHHQPAEATGPPGPRPAPTRAAEARGRDLGGTAPHRPRARILQHPTPEQLLHTAAEVLRLLPPHGRTDRRLLTFHAAGNPHGLDAGTDLAGLVLAEAAAGLTTTAMPTRTAWGTLGVDLDRLGGGLLSLGVHPDSWQVPARFPLVLPPATLTDVHWPAPPHTRAPGCS
ncbi:TIGR02679 domain-containing protein [Streptomyces clavifer]|uniref:TIGR02679 domain-containing protein n=1 Tax=Streptomyces clavifer TaxID=68188 RepID=UPI003321A700